MPTVHVFTRHGSKFHAANVDDATADFLERFGSVPSVDLACGRHISIARASKWVPATTNGAYCKQCARTHPGGTP